MQHSEKSTQVIAWLTKAMQDISAARNDLKASTPFTGSSAFHCQQAVEKALKGFLTWHDQPFRKTHEIRELAAQTIALVPGLEPLLLEASTLTPFATVFRYPGETEEPTVDEALEAIALAESVVQSLLIQLPLQIPSCRP